MAVSEVRPAPSRRPRPASRRLSVAPAHDDRPGGVRALALVARVLGGDLPVARRRGHHLVLEAAVLVGGARRRPGCPRTPLRPSDVSRRSLPRLCRAWLSPRVSFRAASARRQSSPAWGAGVATLGVKRSHLGRSRQARAAERLTVHGGVHATNRPAFSTASTRGWACRPWCAPSRPEKDCALGRRAQGHPGGERSDWLGTATRHARPAACQPWPARSPRGRPRRPPAPARAARPARPPDPRLSG